MPPVQQPTDQKKRRAGTKKSRTGCRTCRVRHIKCDEAPGACRNCKSTGRTCDYDLHRLPRSSRAAVKDIELPLAKVADSFRWAMTTDERRCYSHFQYYTVPSLSEFFDSPLWQELLLQMSLSEPAVYHAVVALSAIHQDLELYGMPLPGQDLQNDYHRFALDQCARSFGLLSRRNASQDPRFREVILICCLLFTFIQLLRGQYDEAFQHLRSGMKIIDEGRTRVDKQPAETCLDVTFANLEIQSLQYGVGRPLEVGNEPKLHTYSDDLGTFSNLAETRQKFDSLLREAYKFLLHAWGLSEAGVSSNYASLHEQQIQLLSQLNQFGHRFESFCLSKTFKRKERKGADMMRLVSRTLILPVKTALIRDNAALEYYVPEYETQISWVEDIMKRYPERPKVMPDIGILPTLYFAATQCRNYTVRHRAIALFQVWPHREGPSDSNWAVFLALKRLEADRMPFPESVASTWNQPSRVACDRWAEFGYNSSFFEAAMESTECMRNWPCVQGFRRSYGHRSSIPQSEVARHQLTERLFI